ncbi:MAG: class I SAM-dependent methyltransferase [Nitrospinales bacterium]
MTEEICNNDEVRVYFDRWHVYRVVIENDYMAHREIHDALRESLRAQNKEAFSVLDLGCGDGSLIARTLDGLPVSKYIGVDLSSVALGEARKNFALLSTPCELVQKEFGEYLTEQETPNIDVILAGFALHHYSNEKKAQFFYDCFDKLNAGGSLYLYDIFCRPGETREEYFQSYCEILNRTWTELSPVDKSSTCEHIRNSDYPVQYKTLAEYAEAAGFTCPSEPLYSDENGFHCFYHFTI